MTLGMSMELILLATGAVLGIWLVIARQAPKKQVQNALLISVVYACAYLGGRFGYILFEAEKFTGEWHLLINFRAGGLSAFGAIWGGVIGFLLACAVQQRSPYSVLDEAASMMFPLAAFGAIARWQVDSQLYQQMPSTLSVYLPTTSLPLPAPLQSPDLLLGAAGWFLFCSFLVQKGRKLTLRKGLLGNLVFTLWLGFWAALESTYGFFRFHPGFIWFISLTAILPAGSWICWLWLGRKDEAH